jgi:drug/metabolite transporter (DMT)-like permease
MTAGSGRQLTGADTTAMASLASSAATMCRALRTRRLGLYLLRGVLNAAAMISFLLAVAITPLAEVAALSFTSPLFATVLAAILLREPVGPRRIAGLLLGFAGALVVVQPGTGGVSLGAGLVLLSCVAWGAALIVIKVLSRTESSLTITLYAGLFLTPITLACALPFWQWPDGWQLVLLAVIGGLGSLTQMAIAQAFHEADASQVMPADLTKLVWSALIGWLFFAGSRPCGWWSAAA